MIRQQNVLKPSTMLLNQVAMLQTSVLTIAARFVCLMTCGFGASKFCTAAVGGCCASKPAREFDFEADIGVCNTAVGARLNNCCKA